MVDGRHARAKPQLGGEFKFRFKDGSFDKELWSSSGQERVWQVFDSNAEDMERHRIVSSTSNEVTDHGPVHTPRLVGPMEFMHRCCTAWAVFC